MTRAVRFHETGGPQVLKIEPVATPSPRPGDVLIRTRALGLNRAEALFRAGAYIENPVFPAGLGLEASGVVEAIGTDVGSLAVGDAVSVIPPISMVASPVHAELIAYPAHRVVKNAPGQSFVEAAATWMAYLTAYGALIGVGGVKAGDTVAITAASSSVGLAAIQIAAMVGARPIALTRGPAKRDALLNAGAAHVVAASDGPLDCQIEAIAGSNGIRVVFDAVGGPQVEALAQTMAPEGILIAYGGLSPDPTPFPLFAALGKQLSLRGYLVHDVTGDDARLDAAIAFVRAGLASGALRPMVARTFAFEEIAEAHRYLESGDQFGKIVVTLDQAVFRAACT